MTSKLSSLLHINYPEDDSLDLESACKCNFSRKSWLFLSFSAFFFVDSHKIIERLANSSKKRVISQEELGLSRENSAVSLKSPKTKETLKRSSEFLSKFSSFSQLQRFSVRNSQTSLKKTAKRPLLRSKTAKEIKSLEKIEFFAVEEDFFSKTEMLKRRLSQ